MKELAPYIPLLLVAALVLRRAGKPQKVNPGRMWIRPLILLLLVGTALIAGPFPGLLIEALFALAAGAGVGVGYLRAHHQKLSIDAKTGRISSQTSTIGTVLVLGLFALRFGLRTVFPETSQHHHAATTATYATNGLLIFTVAMLVTNSILIWNRTRPLVAAHAAGTLEMPPE